MPHIYRSPLRSAVLGLLCSGVLWAPNAHGQGLERSLLELAASNQAAAKAQAKIDDLDDEAARLEGEYQALSRQADALEVYVRQLQTSVDGQQEQLVDLDAQIDRVTDVGRQVVPLMEQMVDVLDRFVELDVPFLLRERRERIAELRRALTAPDVTDAEKYRLIVEAYEIENEYGRTIEAYQGRLSEEASGQVVNFLRFGRVALLYASLDGSSFGRWDGESRSFRALGSGYGPEISRALRMARKQAAPDLVQLPLPPPKEVRP
ncbi:MAG: DUF3450 domain-containing protein [Myxococcota bacterium]